MFSKKTRSRTKSDATLSDTIKSKPSKFLSKVKSQSLLSTSSSSNKKGNGQQSRNTSQSTALSSNTNTNTIRNSVRMNVDKDDESIPTEQEDKKSIKLRSHSSFSFLDKLSSRRRVISFPSTKNDINDVMREHYLDDERLIESDDDSFKSEDEDNKIKKLRNNFRNRKKLRKSQETITKVMARKADLLEYARKPPNSKQLFEASCCNIYDENGTSSVFGSLYTTRKTVVILLRHAYCPMCQAYARTVSELDNSLPIVFILPTHWKVISSYKKALKIPFPIYSDMDRRVYKSLGVRMRSNNPGSIKNHGGYGYNLTSWESMVIAARLTPTSPGDTKQLGGEFVLGPGSNSVHYCHRMITTRGHSPVKDVIKYAVNSIDDVIIPPNPRPRIMSSPGAFNFPSPKSNFNSPLPAGASHPSSYRLASLTHVDEEEDSDRNYNDNSMLELTPSDMLGQTLPSPSPSLGYLSNVIIGREAITPNLNNFTTPDLEVEVVERPNRPPRNFSRPSSLWVKEEEEENDMTKLPPPPLPIQSSTSNLLLDSPDRDLFEIYSSYDKQQYRDDSIIFTPSQTFQSLNGAFRQSLNNLKEVDTDFNKEIDNNIDNNNKDHNKDVKREVDEDIDKDVDGINNFKSIDEVDFDGKNHQVNEMNEDEVNELCREFDEKPAKTTNKSGSLLRRIENTARNQLQHVYPNDEFDSSFGVNRFNSIPLWRPRIR